MTFTRRRALLAAPILAATLGTAALAQDAARPLPGLGNFALTPSGPQATPTPSATPVPAPAAPTPSLPASSPTPVPRATPSPAPRKTPAAKPTPSPTPTASATPTPAETPTAVPSATPVPSPAPTATPTQVATPTRVVAPAAVPAARPGPGAPLWPWLAGAALLALAGGWAWSRRRRPEDDGEGAHAPEPVAAPQAPARPRAWLALALRPTRAGLNMLSATVDCEITVTNRGDAPATDIRVKAQLLSASGAQDAAVVGFGAEPIVRPAAPAFGLAPGEERRLRTVVALPRDAIEAITASGRPMFIPLVALNARYAGGEGVAGQTVQAFAVGVERVDSPKLAPFWLDGAPKMQDAVAARPYAVAVER